MTVPTTSPDVLPHPAHVISTTALPAKDRRRDRLLRIKLVIARTGLSVATIYRREADGTFPKKERIGPRSVGWYESDIDDFVADPLNYRSP
ncbi:MAG: AlpA family transcriptional regulator [Sphingomonas bacterium]|uniref:helix-turn-helix transcriptional regulator n=1 Tax=Sphingomonas bacterium TaxID=1895847 RepID=UPI00260DE950|nr:AlpA family phage regulatory protein [Sphingomonas bacterium]MDB5711911.1 AlpA family transcriptional regulator [Sphingomonas bacterium]